jgi:hypothetical protein
MKKEFIKFLKDNGVLIPFICNLAMSTLNRDGHYAFYHGGTPNSKLTFDQYLEKVPDQEWIFNAFNWALTDEANASWSDLHIKWTAVLSHNAAKEYNKISKVS